jgi:hypothetical protein
MSKFRFVFRLSEMVAMAAGHEVLYSHSRSGAKIAALILELLVSRLEFETAAPLCFTLGIPGPALGSLG